MKLTFSLLCLSYGIIAKPYNPPDAEDFTVGFPNSGIKGSMFEPDASPNTPDENFQEIQPPFSQKCEHHVINSKNTGTPKHHMEKEDVLAFYPMMPDQSSQVSIIITTGQLLFKAIIKGLTFQIYQCYNGDLESCKNINEVSIKGREFVNNQQWNYFYGTLSDNLIQLSINNRTTLDVECDRTLEEMQDAEWYFGAEDINPNAPETGITGHVNPGSGWHYVAQYPCSEFRSANPEKHTGDEDVEPGVVESTDVSLIVGIIIGCALLVIVLAIIVTLIVKGCKNRRSANISSETAPIKGTK